MFNKIVTTIKEVMEPKPHFYTDEERRYLNDVGVIIKQMVAQNGHVDIDDVVKYTVERHNTFINKEMIVDYYFSKKSNRLTFFK